MASYNELNALIDAYINRNGVQAITGQILNGVLKAMVEQLGRGYTIMGAATPTTDPGTPDGPECYFASTPGTYTDFDGLQVVPGELALLCYTPTDGWTKETIYEGFRQVGATIDGNVGTPSVGVSYTNGVLSFDFRNMKGNPGDAAGFGTIGADIAGGVGTPGVSVESSGPATAKNLQFHFTNLKGETGVTSVVATVDNTIGTPTCTVSLVGQQLTLAFSGLKGAQGNSGYQGSAGELQVVNNLTDGGATAALSAEMGKELDGKVSQLQQKVVEKLPTNLFNPNDPDVLIGKFINYAGTQGSSASYNASGFIPVEQNTTYYIAQNSVHGFRFVAPYDSTKTIISVSSSGFEEVRSFTTPSGCKFVRVTFYATDYNVAQVSRQGETYAPYNPIKGYLTEEDTRLGNLETSFGDLSTEVDELRTEVFGTYLDMSTTPIKTYDDNGTWYSGGDNYQGFFVAIPPGSKIEVKTGSAGDARVSFLTAIATSGSVSYGTPNGIQNCTRRDAPYVFQTDSSTKYMWIGTKAGSNILTPEYVKVYSMLPDYEQYFLKVPKSQLFDRSAIEVGYCGLDGWVNTGATGYVYTPKIDVSRYVGRTIFFSAQGVALTAKSFRFVTVYDSSLNVQQNLGVNSASQNIPTFIVPEGAAYIVISYTNPASSADMAYFQAEIDTITPFSAYELVTELDYSLVAREVEYNIKKGQTTANADVLAGKKWVACGDSFTHGDFTNAPENDYTIEEGQYAGQYKVYPYLIGNRCGMTIVNEAVNGSTMTYVNELWSAFSKENGRYTQIPEDADIITFKFGINDDSYHQDAPIGTIDDNTNETFYGAWNIVLDYIITNHPQAKIGIIITNGATLDIVNATIAIAEKWGLPYLNEATDKQCSFMYRSNRTDVVASVRNLRNLHWRVAEDNMHPNALAHEYESTVIEAWLRTL